MARLQKELDVVRVRAAERLEQKLKKTVWQRLTDPLKRHSHSWINVGAVLLAYILAHNLYQTAREMRKYKEELEEATIERDTYKEALRNLVSEETLKEISTICVQELFMNEKPLRGSFWNRSGNPPITRDQERATIEGLLEKEFRRRFGDHVLTDEERRIKELQKAWQESQNQIVDMSPEQKLIESVFKEDASELLAQEGSSKVTQRRVISM